MSHYFDTEKKRWRFSFNRIIGAQRVRATKLLPKGWSKTKAEKYDHEKTAELYALASGVERPEPLIDAAVTLYIDHRCPNLKSGRRIIQNLAFLTEYIEGRPISQVADAAREYLQDSLHLATGTLHNRLAYLKAACRYAWKKHKLTEHDPTAHMEVPKPKNEREVQLPIGRVHDLLLAIDDPETRALYTLALRTGSRWIKGIHPRQPADVHRAGRDVWLHVGITKNGSPRMKWVHPDAHWALAYLPFKLSAETYYKRFCQARAKVGLPDLWAHDIRHVIATDIRKRGGSLGDVTAALDHDSYQSAERYGHITPEHVKRVLKGVGGAKKMHTEPSRRHLRKAA